MKKIVWLPKCEVESENGELYECFFNDPPTAWGAELSATAIEEIKKTHCRTEVEISPSDT